MTIKTLNYSIPLPLEMYDVCLDAYARATGWQDASEDTKLEHSRKALNAHMNSTITSYQAVQAAEAARVAVIEQSTQALDSITTILTVE